MNAEEISRLNRAQDLAQDDRAKLNIEQQRYWQNFYARLNQEMEEAIRRSQDLAAGPSDNWPFDPWLDGDGGHVDWGSRPDALTHLDVELYWQELYGPLARPYEDVLARQGEELQRQVDHGLWDDRLASEQPASGSREWDGDMSWLDEWTQPPDFMPKYPDITPESQLNWQGLSAESMSSKERELYRSVLNADDVLAGRSINIEGRNMLTMDQWAKDNGISMKPGTPEAQRWQDVFDRGLFERTAAGNPVHFFAGGGWTAGEAAAAEAGAKLSGIKNIPFWPD